MFQECMLFSMQRLALQEKVAMALGNQTSLDADLQPMAMGNQTSLDADLQIAPDANESILSPVKMLICDDDEANVNEPISLPAEDADVEIAPHHNPFFKTKLLNWNWDDVIVVPCDDDEAHLEEDISTSVNTQVHVKTRKHVYALIDESDSDDEPYWSNAFLF
nr:hypothetical protein [Tanacetum cinerariifolium]